jgi:hypothetical protein
MIASKAPINGRYIAEIDSILITFAGLEIKISRQEFLAMFDCDFFSFDHQGISSYALVPEYRCEDCKGECEPHTRFCNLCLDREFLRKRKMKRGFV